MDGSRIGEDWGVQFVFFSALTYSHTTEPEVRLLLERFGRETPQRGV